MPQLLLIELNEVNFAYVRRYAAKGLLPTLSRLIDAHGIAETTSETRYEELEPWIQWVTAHTGLSFSEHRVFRLGDIVNTDLLQIWEALEKRGLKVGAMSPMNARNRCNSAAFFVPDPWTPERTTGPTILARLHAAVAQAVNDNAQTRLTASALLWLLVGAARYARIANYFTYAGLVVSAWRRPWTKAVLLDLLLADTFVRETQRSNVDFASLFVNGAAHIQHHYMFNSAAYDGDAHNPHWYVSPGKDPVLDVYRVYDRIVAQVVDMFPESRIMIATGLHQDPYPSLTYYWRLRDHAEFLRKVGISFERVEPRMSRDFLIHCGTHQAAAEATSKLASVRAEDGIPLFEADNRGTDIFAMLTYPKEITPGLGFSVGAKSFADLHEDVSFVALKNGDHNGIGYFIDTGIRAREAPSSFQLKDLPHRICAALGTAWPATAR
jgi:hypothetical protein